METLESVEQYNEIINGKVVLVFSADWCPDCRVIEPVLPELEEAFPAFTFYHVDRDQLIDLCIELNVFGIPSFIGYDEGEELGRFVSKDRKTKEEIEGFLMNLVK